MESKCQCWGRISRQVETIIFTLAGLVIFNTDCVWTFVPALSKTFFTYLPWINLLGVVQIIFNLYQLRQQTWTLFTCLCNIVIEVGSIALAIAMLKGPSLLDLSPEKLAGTPIANAADVLTKMMGFAPGIVLIIVILIAGIEVAQMVYRLFSIKYETK